MQKKNRLSRLWKKRWFRYLSGFLVLYLICFVLFFIFVFLPGQRLASAAKETNAAIDQIKTAAQTQNLTDIKAGLAAFDSGIIKTEQAYEAFSYMRNWPVVKSYIQDGDHLIAAGKYGVALGNQLVDTLGPFADVVGFTQTGEPAEDISAQEKVARLAVTLPEVVPQLESASEIGQKIEDEISQIDTSKYPTEVGGVAVGAKLDEVKSQISTMAQAVNQAVPVMKELPNMLGVGQERNYIVLFQNDKELRPSGGFITAYAILRFKDGAFSIVESDDIYHLDNDASYLPTPEVITRFLNQPNWFMRDTNLSADFKGSAETFLLYYDNLGHVPVDGVIAIDTYFVENFLKVLGEVELPGFDEPFTADNIVEQLEVYTQIVLGGSTERKTLIGDLMQEIVDRALSAPKSLWPSLIETGVEQVSRRHVLAYFRDPNEQAIAEQLSMAGRIEDVALGTDYLHVNLANLAGLKGNWFTTQAIDQKIVVDEYGQATKTVTLTFNNTGEYSVFNKVLKMYVRLYVPDGSELINYTGGEIPVETLSENGKTVFANFVSVPAQSQQTLTFEYHLPMQILDTYNLYMQKQAGTENDTYSVEVEKNGQTAASASGQFEKDVVLSLPLDGE